MGTDKSTPVLHIRILIMPTGGRDRADSGRNNRYMPRSIILVLSQLTIPAAQQDGFDRHLYELDPSQFPKAAMVSTPFRSSVPASI
jgi:hypothetical protein